MGFTFSISKTHHKLKNLYQPILTIQKSLKRELKGKLQDFYDLIGWGDVVSEQRTGEKFFSF